MLHSLQGRLVLIGGACVVLFILAAMLVMRTVAATRSSTYVLSEQTRRVDHGHEYIIHLHRAVAETQAYMLTGETEDGDEAREALTDAQEQMDALSALTQSTLINDELRAHRQALFEQRTALFNTVSEGVEQTIEAVETNNSAVIRETGEAFEQLEQQIDRLEDTADAEVNVEIAAVTEEVETGFERTLYAVTAVTILMISATLGGIWFGRRTIVKSVVLLSAAARAVANGDLGQTIEAKQNDEIGTLQRSFNEMIAKLRDQRTVLQTRNAELERSAQQQQQLFETVQQLSTPLLPLAQGVVALPIVGHVDTQRADAIMHTLLQGVAEQRARVAILDVTGIAVLDTHVTKLLFQAIQSVELLGARVLLAGISATMAQVIVEQGIDFGHLATYRDLGTALDAVRQSDPHKVTRRSQVASMA